MTTYSSSTDDTRSTQGNPARLFAVVAFAEMVTWTLLILGMIGKYVLQLGDLGDLGVRIGGSLHGFAFLCFCLVTVLVAVDQRWSVRDLLMGLASAVIPYATVPFERSALRRGLLGQRWRLRDEPGRGPVEKVVAESVRHPLPAALVAGLTIVAVFSALLLAGPPTQWFS
ncbi:integral membrane protein [Kineosphaera limosa]|uniref:DUF3817 domain-containing protein n=1 Tax=Kineosphaera limosa NBRC 100340 TaxID=1184609 RepID=K6WA24_9MICO|nr:DUF3817 domain-containing protein [Kineosphaera limosa]NYE02418.1 integral membrane protein [Kineosphaera limosa]GAB96055.1 hypothetical protein KILIM_031_00270 [Kineosphaera limosa NBRC 100340]